MTRALLACITACLGLAACQPAPSDHFPGYAEADYVRLASPVGGTLAKLHLQRGQQVKAGALAFALEQENEQAARLAAQARLQRAEAALANLLSGRRPDEVAVTASQLAQAEAAQRQSQAALARVQRLQSAQFVAQASLDDARAAAERDTARVNELRAALRVAALAARPQEIAAARQDVEAARAALAQADWQLNQKAVRVPRDAAVADLLYREGELVAAGQPVVSLLVPEYVRARFFVPQTVLGTIKLGQPVTLRCDGCPAPLAARISYIAREAEFTAPLIYSKENRASLVFMVEAQPEPGSATRLHPGQPLEVRLAPSAP
ncbi:HlyD family secretion protein [Massilia sp. TS11]|uniref:HlyD family secretion protein n=1 Tax=Massilia sp. TS11 TaxID=2908003 RepID=UPI001EDA7F25|nr:HlyD family efflux transporter periplasmic adaptor subunit [Massilia sp. TS11]MCG2583360.1 HlyD family efflux transporter periplasmic adaptor subunit [Massilia sp. TS11]